MALEEMSSWGHQFYIFQDHFLHNPTEFSDMPFPLTQDVQMIYCIIMAFFSGSNLKNYSCCPHLIFVYVTMFHFWSSVDTINLLNRGIRILGKPLSFVKRQFFVKIFHLYRALRDSAQQHMGWQMYSLD